MSYTVEDLISTHSTNPVRATGLTSGTDKTWAKHYPFITKFFVYTAVDVYSGDVQADFNQALLPQYDDDLLRIREPAFPPTYRAWTLSYEEDVVNWHHTEVPNIVLGAFARYPSVLQSSHERPLGDQHIPETVDVAYSIRRGGTKAHITIGEMKWNLIRPRDWQAGNPQGAAQIRLSQELRGCGYPLEYLQTFLNLTSSCRRLIGTGINTPVHRYSVSTASTCSYCNSGPRIRMISRAPTVGLTAVLPRDNPNGTTLRYALYRFIVQGFRRCQGMAECGTTICQVLPRGASSIMVGLFGKSTGNTTLARGVTAGCLVRNTAHSTGLCRTPTTHCG